MDKTVEKHKYYIKANHSLQKKKNEIGVKA
jgi:hypothetical protein